MITTPYPYPWQEKQWQQFMRLRKQERLPHALLFTGLQGVGKRDFANAMAASLLCEKPDTNYAACKACRTCKLRQAQTHPDFIVIEPEEAGKAIAVDQVRNLTANLSQCHFGNTFKVIIIEPADALNLAASNALLKTLEEPQAKTVLILLTNSPSSLVATLRSRCQSWLFPPVSASDATLYMDSNEMVSAEQREGLMHLAQGAPLRLEVLLENECAEIQMQFLKALVDITASKESPLKIAARFEKYDLSWVTEIFIYCLMDCIRFKSGLTLKLQQSMNDSMQALLKKLSIENLFKSLDKVYAVNKALKSKVTLNKQLQLDDLFCSWGQ